MPGHDGGRTIGCDHGWGYVRPNWDGMEKGLNNGVYPEAEERLLSSTSKEIDIFPSNYPGS